MILHFCFDFFLQNIKFNIKETDLSIFLDFLKLSLTEVDEVSGKVYMPRSDSDLG